MNIIFNINIEMQIFCTDYLLNNFVTLQILFTKSVFFKYYVLYEKLLIDTKMMGCGIKANCKHLKPGSAGKMASLGGLSKEYTCIYASFGENHKNSKWLSQQE